jgi:hypothetical protein
MKLILECLRDDKVEYSTVTDEENLLSSYKYARNHVRMGGLKYQYNVYELGKQIYSTDTLSELEEGEYKKKRFEEYLNLKKEFE